VAKVKIDGKAVKRLPVCPQVLMCFDFLQDCDIDSEVIFVDDLEHAISNGLLILGRVELAEDIYIFSGKLSP
jgi:hypothetical protein